MHQELQKCVHRPQCHPADRGYVRTYSLPLTPRAPITKHSIHPPKLTNTVPRKEETTNGSGRCLILPHTRNEPRWLYVSSPHSGKGVQIRDSDDEKTEEG